jgi:hypothetical protein
MRRRRLYCVGAKHTRASNTDSKDELRAPHGLGSAGENPQRRDGRLQCRDHRILLTSRHEQGVSDGLVVGCDLEHQLDITADTRQPAESRPGRFHRQTGREPEAQTHPTRAHRLLKVVLMKHDRSG